MNECEYPCLGAGCVFCNQPILNLSTLVAKRLSNLLHIDYYIIYTLSSKRIAQTGATFCVRLVELLCITLFLR